MNKKELKNKGGITLVALVITIIILIILATVTINVLSGDNGLVKQAQLAKDLSSNTTESEFYGMNSLFDEYVNMMSEDANIDEDESGILDNFKKLIASAITNAGVKTSETDSVDIMVENIGKILEEKTKDATATPENISKGKTAWVRGQKITGNGEDYNNAYNSGYVEGYNNGQQERNIKQYSMTFSIGINTTKTYNLDDYVQDATLIAASITGWSEPYTAKATSFQLTTGGNTVTLKYSSGDVGFSGSGTLVFYYYE